MKLIYSIGSVAISIIKFFEGLILLDPLPLDRSDDDWFKRM